MPYTDTPPLFSELRTALRDDLRDPLGKTFGDTSVLRYLNDGIVEINRVYPLHVTDDVALVQDQVAYDTRFTSIYRCEFWDTTTFVDVIPYNDGDSIYGGYDLVGTTLVVPPSVVSAAIFTAYTDPTLKATGYARRQLIPSGDDGSFQTELDGEAALAVRWFAQYRAFTSLLSDRTLFKQWQSESNNTDVSMPMLLNLWQVARGEWERHERAMRTLRRVPVGSPVVI